MKRMKRMLSLLLVCVMAMGMFGIVPASATENSGYFKGDINFFSSFSDFKGTDTVPSGFVNIQDGARLGGIDSVTYNTVGRTSTVARIGGDKQPVIPFNTNFLDGYMHVSFDYLQTNENSETTTDRMLSVLFSRRPTENETNRDYYDVNSGNIVKPGDDDSKKWNSNEYDYTKLVPEHTMELFRSGSREAKVGRVLYTDNSTKLIGATDTNGTLKDEYSTAEDKWYKVDMFFDRSDNRYYVYVDGVLQDYEYKYTKDGLVEAGDNDVSKRPFNNEGNRAIQALIFRCDHLRNYDDGQADDERSDGYVYLDNVYVSQYYANSCTNDTLKMTIDTMGESVLCNGSVINLGFSEWLDQAPEKSDITITNGTDTITDFEILSADQSQATVKIGNGTLEGGTYAISVSGVKGKFSGSAVSNTADVELARSTPANDTKYYWANEDFNNIEAGVIPPNWYYGSQDYVNALDTNKYVIPEAKKYETEVGITEGIDKTNALELKSGDSQNMYYFFPRGVASGDFKAEFDIKHQNGGWTFGFVNYDSYKAANHRRANGKSKYYDAASQAPEITESSKSNESQLIRKMESSILLGMAKAEYKGQSSNNDTYDEFDEEDRAYSPNLGMISATTTEWKNSRANVNNLKKQLVKDSGTDYMQIDKDTWSKVEISVNDTTKKYTVTVTPYNVDGSLNTEGKKETEWTDKDSARYLQGIMGIRFTRNSDATSNTGSVCIDNVKVYKTQTAYLDEDFDDYTSDVINTSNKNELPSGWISFDSDTRSTPLLYRQVDAKTTGVTSASGKDSNTNSDDKSMYLYTGTPSVYKTLNTPIPAGKSFAIDFDIYNKSFTYTEKDGQKTNGCGSEWLFVQMGKEDTQQLPGFNYAGLMWSNSGSKMISKTGKVLVENTSYSAIGADDKNLLINDSKVGSYKPFEDKNVEESYVRINGNSILENTVFGRQNDSLSFKYSPSGRHALKRGFHSSESSVSKVEDVLDEWVHYSVLCEPISTTQTKYTITQTKKNGDSVTTEFTNTRDWMTNDTYGIGFAVPAAWHSGNNGKDGDHGTKIDNVKVYAVDERGNEANAVVRNSIESIKAVNDDATKTADVMAEGVALPVDTKKIEIIFNEPVAEQVNPSLPVIDVNLPEVKANLDKGTFTSYRGGNDEYTDYTNFLDDIKDVISMRKKGSQLENVYSVSLSEDKKTVVIEFNNSLAENDVYTLGVNQNIAFKGNGYAKLDDNFVKTYSVSGDFPEEQSPSEPDTEEINYTKLHATVLRGTAQIPVNKAGALSEGETITTKIEKENTTDEDVKAFVGYAFYSYDAATDTKTLVKIDSEILDIPKDTKRGTGDEKTITVPEGATSFKAFSWSYPTMQPYVELLEAVVE